MKPKNLTVAQVATRTGLTERAIYHRLKDGSLVAHGGRNSITEDAVTQFITNRQHAAAARIGNLERFAEEVRRHMQTPGGPPGNNLPIDQDARDLWGPHVVRAAGLRDNAGCRWCWARLTASVHGGLRPQLTDPHKILLGQPCQTDLQAMWEDLRSRHKTDQATTPTDTAPARTAAAPKSREETRRLAAPRGHKKCGVPVGEYCPCHTSDRHLIASAKPKTKPKTKTPRRELHGCGCQCEQHRSQS